MGDSYRPGRSDRDRDHDRDRDRPPPLAHRMTFTHGNGDTYRPGGSQRQQGFSGRQAEFTFQSSRSAPHFPPSGPANTGSHRLPTRRARGGPPQRNSRRDDNLDMPHNRNKNNVNGSRRGGFRKPAPHERALLRQRDDASPEHTMGISDGPNKFLNIDDLSDDEEADMDVESDLSDGEGKEGDDQPGNQKVARTHVLNRADGDSIPKWSNPDPYTVLPPPEETTGKKTDFVKLIRKAKNQAAEKAAGHNAVAANDDFISFGEDDNTEQEESRLHSAIRPNSWQRHSNGLHIVEDDDPSSHERHGDASTEQPVRGSLNDLDSVDSFVHGPYDGKRADDAAKTDSRLHPSVRSNKRKQDFSVGIVEAWASTPRSSSTPWLRSPGDYAHLARNPDKWLHNEILDFYDYVAPKPYEHDVRHSLVQRVNSALGSRRFPHDSGRILCFGSFPAGLYLPTADMDLVYTSDRYYNGGTPVLDFSQKGAHKSLLYKAARRLRDMHMCIGAPTVIAMAKVPIIKFQDSITNLQVDISFENLSGVQAQATFARWKGDHPDVVRIWQETFFHQMFASAGSRLTPYHYSLIIT